VQISKKKFASLKPLKIVCLIFIFLLICNRLINFFFCKKVERCRLAL